MYSQRFMLRLRRWVLVRAPGAAPAVQTSHRQECLCHKAQRFLCAGEGACGPQISLGTRARTTGGGCATWNACATRNSRKKLRYMSKFAAIFVGSDNTRLSCTQPIANLLMVCSYVFSALLLTFLSQCKFVSDTVIVLFRY